MKHSFRLFVLFFIIMVLSISLTSCSFIGTLSSSDSSNDTNTNSTNNSSSNSDSSNNTNDDQSSNNDSSTNTNNEITYHRINDTFSYEDENLKYTLTKVEVAQFISYPGTRDERCIQIYIVVENLSTNKTISFNKSNTKCYIHLGDYEYETDEIYYISDIKPGGKITMRPYFVVPDHVYQNTTIFSLDLFRLARRYHLYWQDNIPRV